MNVVYFYKSFAFFIFINSWSRDPVFLLQSLQLECLALTCPPRFLKKLSVFLRICELIEYSIGRPLYRPAFFEPIILLTADVHEFSHARFVQYNLAVIKKHIRTIAVSRSSFPVLKI